MPDLSNIEIYERIIQEQKQNIQKSGFENWINNIKLYDNRITQKMTEELRAWAFQEKIMDVKEIIDKHRKASN